MPAFEYSALDDSGRTTRGVADGATARQVRQDLRDQGLVPLAVVEVAEAPAGASSRAGGRLGSTDVALALRQLATLVRSGLPLEQALLAVSQQTHKERVRRIMRGLRIRIREGHSLAESLRHFRRSFPEILSATVEAGEQSGHLDEVLERLADYAERREQLRQKIMVALLYPLFLTVIAAAVVGGLLAYVVPQVLAVFEDLGGELPLLTRGLIFVTGALRVGGVYLLALAAIVVVALVLAFRLEAVRLAGDRLLLRIPFLSYLIRGVNAARLTRSLSVMVGSGVPLVEALRVAGNVVSNRPMRAAVARVAERLREGASFGVALREGDIFPPVTLHLIASGEASGDLAGMLERSAANQERELESLASALTSVVEPALILIVGGLILLIVLAILMPIFELNRLIR
jgi:general secretion pathway protein F